MDPALIKNDLKTGLFAWSTAAAKSVSPNLISIFLVWVSPRRIVNVLPNLLVMLMSRKKVDPALIKKFFETGLANV